MGATNFSNTFILVAEVTTLQDGLKAIVLVGFTKVIIEGDNKVEI